SRASRGRSRPRAARPGPGTARSRAAPGRAPPRRRAPGTRAAAWAESYQIPRPAGRSGPPNQSSSNLTISLLPRLGGQYVLHDILDLNVLRYITFRAAMAA